MSARTFELAGLYTSERKRLHRLIHRIVGNRAVAEDVAQDAFVKLNDRALGPTDHGLLMPVRGCMPCSPRKALPPRTQQIFLLNRVDGLSQVQIAKFLGLSVSTVEKETIRALAFCRAWRKEHDKT
jgi:DNA-directed RNA polymerase specialized sigma24 family protein